MISELLVLQKSIKILIIGKLKLIQIEILTKQYI